MGCHRAHVCQSLSLSLPPCSAATHQVRSLDTEIEGFKKSITQEGERNELLTVLLNRTQLDSATSRKLISHSHSQQEALQVQYSIYMRTLQETEQTLQRVNTVSEWIGFI